MTAPTGKSRPPRRRDGFTDLDTFLAELTRTTDHPPLQLPCGCYLCVCPCCGRRELIVSQPGTRCDPGDSKHRLAVERARS
jgi:hypothetical protein